MTQSCAAVWRAVPPDIWPSAPRYVSVSALADLEACPRRWALLNAAYPEIWEHHGYPRVLHPAALEGSVAHLALEKIGRALSESGCPSVQHPSAVQVLKKLGGFTAIVNEAAQYMLRRHENNPRVISDLERLQQRLAARSADLRQRVQKILARVQLKPKLLQPGSRDQTVRNQRSSGELRQGSYCEVRLSNENLGWRGAVDMLTISDSTCEIRDFKTGEPKDDHQFQLYVYALLWWKDQIRNPSGRLADRLVISYPSGDTSIPAPDESALEEFMEELRSRRAAATQTLVSVPPEARPSVDTCIYCGVRHLCDAYWQQSDRSQADGASFVDLQVKVTEPHAPNSFVGVVESCPELTPQTEILLRTVNLPFGLDPGTRLRVLNVHISVPDPDFDASGRPLAVASMGVASEAFLLPA